MSNKNDFKNRFNEWRRKMYGNDELGIFLLILCVVLQVIAVATMSFGIGQLFSLLSFGVLVFQIYRTFSNNKGARIAENNKFKMAFKKPSKWISDQRYYADQKKKGYTFFVCPHCGEVCRVPKGKGKIKITCPKCSTTFIKKS